LQVNCAAWSEMQPFWTHESPGGHLPPVLRGTQAPATQTLPGPPQSLVIVHGFAGFTQTPSVVLQV
jgi:hypothetical protein